MKAPESTKKMTFVVCKFRIGRYANQGIFTDLGKGS